MRTSWKVTALMAAFAMVSSSCATLFYGPGPDQTVSISTEPPGATVKVDDQQVVSPAQVVLNRYKAHNVVATKPGYEAAATTIQPAYSWATVVDLVLVLPWFVDMVTNSIYISSPDNVNLALVAIPTAQAQATPAAIAAQR